MSRTTECRDNSFFQVFLQEVSFNQGRADCSDRGGDLAIIPDAVTNARVLELNLDGGTNQFLWIGLATPGFTTSTNPSLFRFVDGSRLSNGFGLARGQDPWLPNQPGPTVFGVENGCVLLSGSGLWIAGPCDVQAKFICQIPCAAPITSPTKSPTKIPTSNPTKTPSFTPTSQPTQVPTQATSLMPTVTPTKIRTVLPTTSPVETIVEENNDGADPTMAIIVSVVLFLVIGLLVIVAVIGIKSWQNLKRRKEHERSLVEREKGMNEIFKNTKKLLEEDI